MKQGHLFRPNHSPQRHLQAGLQPSRPRRQLQAHSATPTRATPPSPSTNALLGLGAAGVGDQQCPVVLQQDVLDLVLALLIHVCTCEIRTNGWSVARRGSLRPSKGAASRDFGWVSGLTVWAPRSFHHCQLTAPTHGLCGLTGCKTSDGTLATANTPPTYDFDQHTLNLLDISCVFSVLLVAPFTSTSCLRNALLCHLHSP